MKTFFVLPLHLFLIPFGTLFAGNSSAIDEEVKRISDANHAMVVSKDFTTRLITTYPDTHSSINSEIIDTAYPYFEQMEQRKKASIGSYLYLEEGKASKGYVFFTPSGIIDVDTAKKMTQTPTGEK